jgi:uncharacterized membrane protein YeiH
MKKSEHVQRQLLVCDASGMTFLLTNTAVGGGGVRSFGHDSRSIVSHDYKMCSYTVVVDIYMFVLTSTYKASPPL